MNKLQQQRLKKLNSLLMEQKLPDSMIRDIEIRRGGQGYSAGDVALYGAAATGGVGVSVATVKGFLGLFKQNPKAMIEAMKAAGVGAEEIAKVEAAAGQNLTNPSRTRRALRAIAKPFKFVMEKSSGAVKNTIGEGIKSFWKNAAAQQRYFGKTSKFVFDKASGKLIEKMTTKQIEVAAKEAGKKAFQRTLERSIARRTATALEKGAKLAAKEGKKRLANELVKKSGKVIEAEKRLAQASQKALDAAKKLDTMKAANRLKPFTHGTNQIKRAEDALKAAKELEKKAAKSLKGIGKRAIKRAEREAIKKLEAEAVKKGISKAEQKAIEAAARKTATEAGERMTARVGAQLTAQGGRTANIGARMAATKAAEKTAMTAGAQLTGAAGAGAALSAAFAVLTAAEVGYYIGKGLNAWLFSQTETEEQADRIKKGLDSVQYAQDELDVYFGLGSRLCRSEVECLPRGEIGGYSYETASSEESWTSSFFGLDYGGRNKTKLGFGRFVQVRGFNTKDTLVIFGMLNSIIQDDLKNKRIVLADDGKKYEVKSNAKVKKYIKPFIDFINFAKKYPYAFDTVKNSPEGLKSASTIVTVLGLQPIKIDGKEVSEEMANVEEIVDGYYKAMKGVNLTSSGDRVVFGLSARLMKDPELTRKVELRFDEKYGQSWDTLRNGIDGDFDGDDYKRAIAPFLNSDKVLGPIGKKKPDDKPTRGPTPAGPSKCDNYPITFGCTGKPVGNMLFIATLGTDKGIELLSKDKERINKLIDAGVFNNEVKEIFKQVMPAGEFNAWERKGFTLEKNSRIDRWFDRTASKKGISESLDFYSKLRKNKNNNLTKLLMERM